MVSCSFTHVSLQKYVSFFVGNPVFMNLISQKLYRVKLKTFWNEQSFSCVERLAKILFVLISFTKPIITE